MIGFGLRLALRGGREAAVRLLVTGAAVALGVGLLLLTLAAVNGVNAQNARYAWFNSGVPGATAPGVAPSPDPAWATQGTDLYKDERIIRVDVAATGPRAPVPPGIPRLPGPGEYYASPALGALLRSVPGPELGDRYPGRRAGTIGAAALPSPDSLIIIVGRTPGELAGAPGAAKITTIATESPGSCSACRVGIPPAGVTLVLSVTSAALLFPVLIFIGTATRMAAARREQRFAAMRLVGATPRQISVVSAVESTVAAGAGTAAGFALFLLFRVPLAAVPFTGARFHPGDLSLDLTDVLLVAVGVPLGSAIAARLALRRVRISPLGVTRRVTPRPPRAYRLIPLVAGVAELAYFVGRRPDTTAGQAQAYLTGILLMMAGLVIAGPWLTMAGARLMARRTGRPAALIAGRRLADDPKAGFRAISGLVLALFVSSTAVGVMTTMVAERGVPRGTAVARSTLVADYSQGHTSRGAPRASVGVPDTVLARLRAIPGVQRVTRIHTNPLGTTLSFGGPERDLGGLASCRELEGVPDFGRCAPGADVVTVPQRHVLDAMDGSFDDTWPAAAMSAERLRDVPVQTLVVGTNGSKATIERVRTALALTFPHQKAPVTAAEHRANSEDARLLTAYQRLAAVVVLVSLCVAGCGLAVSVIGGLHDRKRPFGLLRLTGVRLGTLRRVVLLESAVPLLIVAVVAIGSGFLAAQLFLRSQMDYALRAPGAEYYVTVLIGLAVSLGVIAATFPLLAKITGPGAARNE
ncbi:ABC transporter permease [Actinomadura viridis]|uniref:ABC-type lipoprotein release transport system permease subunit n=1 Tax=Actinomadura viridis TaxID=58110 RepID=A0A931DJR8_9ACTN|nr:ABC transporter permease [Actinomadura viridis]MBG6091300.1 ABC-type lipoprotein release transport system permease subunit [Actinomadura viridis]